jgi:hypothetical protein
MPTPLTRVDDVGPVLQLGETKRKGRGTRVDRVRRAGSQGFTIARASDASVLVPEVLVDTGQAGSASGYGSGASTVMGDMATIDASGAVIVPPLSASLGPRDCLLPRASAIDEQSGTLLLACFGIDEVIAYDARSKRPHDAVRHRIRVGAGPTGVAVDAERRRAVAWS